MEKKRRILVTSALPYANGSIHIGHLVEYITTDIWVRFQNLRGHECRYMCADDTHGTPVMLSARKQGVTPEELVGRMHAEHKRDFADFHVKFDNYYSTNSPENREFSELIYQRLREKGHIVEREIQQTFCPSCAIFLPDRLIRGTCPRCGTADQYGDSCEACSATYNPTELKDARCAECGSAPITKSSRHYFFRLSDFQDRLRGWVETGGHVQADMQAKILEWFGQGLKDWDISRDAPYFGFRIPGTEDKYFYVWLDAPIGYMASLKNWCQANGRGFEEFWGDPDSEIVHFIGKDIVYFHTLFWPAMLMGADFKTPSRVNVHGFLTVDGEKMSKSRGTFISAREYLDHLDPEYLRYYYACKQNGSVDDVGLHLKDFCERVNTDLGNQFVNLGSRVIAFLHKNLGGRLSGVDPEGGEELLAAIEAAADEVAAHYEKVDFGRAMKLIISLAHQANQYVATRAPWVHAGKDPETARRICTTAINAFAKMGVMLSPVLPVLAARVDALMDRSSPGWDEIKVRCLDRPMKPFSPIFTKIDPDAVTRMVEAVKARSEAAAAPASAAPACTVEPLSPEVSFDAFAKVDLRVALILEAAEVPGADKLLKLRIDLGPLGTRQIFAGIRKSHQAAALVGRKIIVVANLAARKMKFGLSEGMLLAAGAGDKDIFLLGVEDPAKPGEKIH